MKKVADTKDLSMDVFEHPGNLGRARGSLFTVHHADWPAYPLGDDFLVPLLHMTAFSPGTEFIVIDDIDRSMLLVADVSCGNINEPFDPRNFHIAIWHEDLSHLVERELIKGGVRVTERRWHEKQWQKLTSKLGEGESLGYLGPDETFVPIEKPNFDDFDDNPDHAEFLISPEDRIVVTNKGRQFLLSKLFEEEVNFSVSISKRVGHLFELKYYDTCVREACVLLEHEIKEFTGSQAWGEKLTKVFLDKIRQEKRFLESHVRTFQQELRSTFKFIRNDYMHNLADADKASTYAILFRIARVRSMLDFGN